MRSKVSTLIWALIACLPLNAQYALTPAPEHFEKFNNVENGWCASDATISLLLPDGNTLWLWGDCIIGEKESTFDVKNGAATMINNAAIIEHDGIMTTYYQGSMDEPSSLIPGEGSDIFWPEHATIEDDTLKVFAIRIIHEDTGIPGFNFRVGTTHLAYFTYPGMEHIKTKEIAYITDSTMRFGTHVFEDDGYTYIFGKKDILANGHKYPVPMLARVEESVDDPWEFYAGGGSWTTDCSMAVPVGNRPMSESFFVYKKNNKYYMLMHEIWLIGALYILEADAITGPWNRMGSGGIENKFAVIEPHGKNITYNLFAHPHFNQDEQILISYNVNNTDFWPIFDDTRNYRARFFWLDVEKAVNTTVPDTLYYDDSLVGIEERRTGASVNRPVLRVENRQLVIEGVKEELLLDVYGLEGRKFLSRRIYSDEVISLNSFPAELLLIRLKSREDIQHMKIVNIK